MTLPMPTTRPRPRRTTTPPGHRRTTTLLAAAVGVVLLAGCGGGGSRLSKADFEKQGNGICTDLAAKRKTAAAPTSQDPKVLADYVGSQLTSAREQLDALRKLSPPKDEQGAYDTVLTTISTSLTKADGGVAKLRSGDLKGAKADLSSLDSGGVINKGLTDLGLTACAK